MALLPVNPGAFALVDDDVYAWAKDVKWSLTNGYAARCKSTGGRQRTVYLHRLIVGAEAGQLVDHINRDKTDCRRTNLRICTAAENSQNRNRGPTISGFLGVYTTPRRKSWWAEIIANGRVYRGPRHKEAIEAARDRDRMARELHGDFAVLNFPDEAA